MSRSYQKVLGWTDTNSYWKKQANKKVRRTKRIPNGGAYRKILEPWLICDFRFLYFSVQEYHDCRLGKGLNHETTLSEKEWQRSLAKARRKK